MKKGHGELRFVVQMHDASRLHYDIRLEFDGVYKSWAVPKGPSLNPLDQRLAVFVEDHPIDYGTFEGIIPSGNYGAGTVMLWDRGTYVERSSSGRKDSEKAMLKGLAKGHITFVLSGEKLKGEFALIKLKKNNDQKNWLLVKKRDEHSSVKRNQAFDNTSVKTGRTLEQIAEQAEAAGDVWFSHRGQWDSGAKKPPKKTPALERARERRSAMPRKIKPMLPTVGVVDSGDWLFDEDPGGLRAIAEVDGRNVHLHSKSLLSFDKKFPEIIEQLKSLEINAVLDGEIVKHGKAATYHVFDILYCDGKDLRDQALTERKKILAEAFIDSKIVLKTKPAKKSAPAVAKRAESIYSTGVSGDWLQVKNAGAKKAPVKRSSIAPHATAKVGEDVQLTNLEKLYFPDDGITKGDVINYYRAVAPYILPYLKDRPESLNRHPNGILQPGFYQKDLTGHIPRWFKTHRVYSQHSDRSIDYALIQDERSLLYVANLGCIELNPWFSRIQKPEHPDFMVIDLDPDDNPFHQVIEVAHEVHRILDAIGAENFVKTSGATGIHIGVPMGAKYDYEKVRDLAEKVCKPVLKKFASFTSMERSPSKRRKKIYLDCLQNRRGQTLAAPFCIRPKPRAPVSMPVTWKELTNKLKPEQFHIKNAPSRISKFDDPWAGVLGKAVDINKCLKTLARFLSKA